MLHLQLHTLYGIFFNSIYNFVAWLSFNIFIQDKNVNLSGVIIVPWENNDTAIDTHAPIAAFIVVDDKRFELSTSAMRTQRSPS